MAKMFYLTASDAAKAFAMLNPGKVMVTKTDDFYPVITIVTDTEPKELVYPEGWYYANGNFTNKHNSTTGIYDTILMVNSKGDIWEVPYCTAD